MEHYDFVCQSVDQATFVSPLDDKIDIWLQFWLPVILRQHHYLNIEVALTSHVYVP